MNDKLLIEQLKSLRNIHPDKNWVALTRTNLQESAAISQKSAEISGGLGWFTFVVPKPLAVPVLAAIVALVGGVAYVQNSGQEGVFVSSVKNKSLSVETKEEIKEIASAVSEYSHKSASFSVVFNEDSDAQTSFKDALRNRIEAKIGRIKDLFAQLEDGDLAREISLNPRRLEENFKLADGKLAEQVKTLLADAEAALLDGNLIDALELVNAIDKLLD